MTNLSERPIDEQEAQYFKEAGVLEAPKVEEVKEEVVQKSIVEKTESTPQPDVKEEAVASSDEEKPAVTEEKKERKVDYGALHEERAKRKAAEEKLKALEEQLKSLPKQANEQEKPLPVEEKIEQLQNLLFEQIEQQQERELRMKLNHFVKTQEEEFMAKTPDYLDAVRFLEQSARKELELKGFQTKELNDILRNEADLIIQAAIRDNVNPAERFYHLAAARGFSRPEAPKQTASKTQKVPAKSLSKVTGGPSSPLTIDSLSSMSGPELLNLSEEQLYKILSN